MAMVKISYICDLWVVLFLIYLSSSAQSLNARRRRQGDVLTRLLNAKLREGYGVGSSSSDFEAFQPNSNSRKAPPPEEQRSMKADDLIPKLPGQPSSSVSFTQHAGYVTVDKSAGRALFYYFVEPHGGNSLPLVLWLNGGPGCSSLLGAMAELGPFRVASDGKTLYQNPYAWSKVANVLFLETPAGVGFSYSNTTSDYKQSGDKRTADDNVVFLLNWLERFPEYKGRDFYITGESYAGHYVPQLASAILHKNNKFEISKKTINLKGIMIGNAVITDSTDNKGQWEYWQTHALISKETLAEIQRYCYSKDAPKYRHECNTTRKQIDTIFDFMDMYNIYAPLCTSDVTAHPRKASVIASDPCAEDYLYYYLNHPGVQKALHANTTHLKYDWEECSDMVYDSWTYRPPDIAPLLKDLLTNGLRVWIYSGDIDGRVPVTSTLYSIENMKLQVKMAWRPWLVDGEVAGFTQGYDEGLIFATVRGAGHEVPRYQPKRALTLIKNFLLNTPLPFNKTASN